MDPSYAALYRQLFEKHWWWRDRQRYVLDRLQRVIGHRRGGAILDIGCGDGLLLAELESFGHPEGLERDVEIVSQKNRERWTIHLRPFDDRFDPGKRYSLILMLDVLEHLDDPQGALRHVFELLEPGGLFLATVPAHRALWTRHDDLNLHRTRYRKQELIDELREAGLAPRECRHFFHWLVPVKLALRFAETIFDADATPPRLPNPLANHFFHLVTRLEQLTWGRIGLPFGTSILAVAEKSPPVDGGPLR